MKFAILVCIVIADIICIGFKNKSLNKSFLNEDYFSAGILKHVQSEQHLAVNYAVANTPTIHEQYSKL